jgi:UDP-2,3-diacylglucosamine hydrolase
MIGLFFGDTEFPKKILLKLEQKNKKYIIIDLSKKKFFRKNPHSQSFAIGQFSKIFRFLLKNKCKKVLFAGKIHKPKFSSLKVDFKGLYYMPRIIKAAKLGDAAILKAIIKILINEKIKVVNSNTYNPELTLSKGCYTKLKPNKKDFNSINRGIKSLGLINPHNHVQGLVVRDSIIVAKEKIHGTKKMLQMISKDKNSQGILIKFPKKNQDLRIDLPTIGFDTLKDCKKFGIKGIVLKSKKNIFIDKNQCIKFANKNKIFIIVK